jgi:RNA polymerase sigma factor (TIGR02999 family)
MRRPQEEPTEPPTDPDDVTMLLRHLGAEGIEISESLVERVYKELKLLAAFQLKAERKDHTLQPTALVNEAYLRLQGYGQWASRGHFFRVASKVMRQVLVDYARARKAKKRGGENLIVPLDANSPQMASQGRSADDVIALDQALSELARQDPRQALIVEMRFFGGLSEQDICSVLNIAERTVRRDWESARALLYGQLKRGKRKPEERIPGGQARRGARPARA